MSQPAPEQQRPHIHDYGFSVLSDPVDATSDLVFVHGLQGHPEKTWTYASQSGHEDKRWWLSSRRKNKSTLSSMKHPVYWPYDLLGERLDLAKTRMLTYGYDSVATRFFGATNKQNIMEHGNDLMVALEQERQGAARTRPLIFVAHSLGGILVKAALNKSWQHDDPHIQCLSRSTRGVVFLGTPHRGSAMASLGSIVTKLAKLGLQDANSKVIRGLSPDNELLEEYSDTFSKLVRRYKIRVCTFYESKAMTRVYGIEGMVVPRESALIRCEGESERGLNANHSEMCKFSGPDDSNYRAVSGAIVDLIEDATKLPSPTAPLPTGSPVPNSAPSFRLESGNKQPETGPPPMYQVDHVKQTSLQVELGIMQSNSGVFSGEPGIALGDYLKALKVPNDSKDTIQTSTPPIPTSDAQDNLNWLFASPEFNEWHTDDVVSILWLGGKSSQENSAAVRHLLQQILDTRASIFSYLHAPTATSKKLALGSELLDATRELLRQIIREDRSRMMFAIEKNPLDIITRPTPYGYSSHDWELQKLMSVLVDCLVAKQNKPTYLIFDAAELPDINVNQFLSQFVRLLNTERDEHAGVVLKVLFASSPRLLPKPLDEPGKRLASIPYIDKRKELQGR
ncbi:hypothetical protein F4777DRAFT_584825 [Nemania sp. FL0916]|nr:hypothetical protein F4777DRAFT_584825 [Nemania sp. FL0916]